MFDLDKFYESCKSGNKVDMTAVIEYIKYFDKIIIWGAAGLGKAIGQLLEECNVKELIYWDQRYEEIGPIANRKIEAPFSSEYDRKNSLIMYAIPNHVIMASLLEKLKQNGYENVIRGDIFYSGTICPYCLGDKPSAKRCWQRGECRSVICKRLQNIVNSNVKEEKPGERIELTYNCFIINSICNLSCTHCVQFINNYPKDKMVNIPTEQICRDIDDWLNMIDSVGTISVMGGETFIHPDINIIAKKFAEHDNFGFVSFPTNGLYPIKPEQLEGIEDKRIVIAFGAYQHIASQKQLEIYEKNVELVKSFDIAYTESRHLPTWVVPSGLYVENDSVEFMTAKKRSCLMPPRNLQIRAGKIHVCDRGVALYAAGVADYPEDYFLLNEKMEISRKRQLFREFVDKPYYRSCSHCGDSFGNAPSAIQGKINVFDKQEYINRVWEKNL